MDVSLPKIILRIHVAKTVQSPIFIGSEIRTHSVTQMRQACLPLCRHIYTTSVKVDLISFNPFIGRKRKRGEKNEYQISAKALQANRFDFYTR